MTTYPNGTVLPQGASDLLTGEKSNIWYTSPDGMTRLYLSGALEPWPGIQGGVILTGGAKGLTADFKQLTLKSARQAGITWQNTVWDQLKITLPLEAHGQTPQELAAVVSEFIGAFPPDKTGTLEWITNDRGYWYCEPRRAAGWPDALKKMPRTVRKQAFTHQIAADGSFWYGFPSIDRFAPGVDGSGFLTLQNIGDQDTAPTILCVGPGTFSWSNGDCLKTSTMITFGPLEAGQSALVMNSDRLRNVIDLTSAPQQTLTSTQKLLAQIINFVTNNDVPPLMQQFESAFGILPPQGPLYSLLTGRYTNPIPGVAQPQWATPTNLRVSITGATSASKMVARIDPMRVWPE